MQSNPVFSIDKEPVTEAQKRAYARMQTEVMALWGSEYATIHIMLLQHFGNGTWNCLAELKKPWGATSFVCVEFKRSYAK